MKTPFLSESPKTRILIVLCLYLLTVVYGMSLVAGEPMVIATGDIDAVPKQPQMAIAQNGSLHMVFGIGDQVHYCLANRPGEPFSKPTLAFQVPNMSLGMRRGPRIVTSGKTIVVTAIGGVRGKGQDGDLVAWRSMDEGITWRGPVRVNDIADAAREGLHGMAASNDGKITSVWLDLRTKGTKLYLSQSIDAGESWTKNELVYDSPEGFICQCCHPSIAIGTNKVHVLFRNALAGNRDMYLTTATQGTNRFGSALKLGLESWKLNACPMDGGMLSVEPDGTIVTVWRRGDKLFTVQGDGSPETEFGTGEQPWVASTSKGSYAIWTSRREGELLLKRLPARETKTIASIARDPMMVAPPNGKGPLVACWETRKDGKFAIVAAVVDSL